MTLVAIKMNVTFSNKPRFSEYKVDQDFNERKNKLVPLMENFLSKHPLFLDSNVNVTFLHSGVSSLVSIIETTEKKSILKIPLSKLNARLEGVFLKAWQDAGVKVPHVLEEGEIGEHPYILMEYIDSETISNTYTQEEMLEKNIYEDLGKLLKKMHQVKSKGFSNIVNKESNPEYPNISSWLAGDSNIQNQMEYVKEHNILNDQRHGSINNVLEIIISTLGDTTESVYCHNDFHEGNIFVTEKSFTVFDPWPCFHHPFTDIARSLILFSKNNMSSISKQFLGGYFVDEKYDEKLLHAFLFLNIALKIPYMHKTSNVKKIKMLQEYLEEKKYLLV
jgi:fructosamine-3-kinase